MKIHPVGAELLHADGRSDRHTDMTELIVDFRNFEEAPKIEQRHRSLSITLLLPDSRCSYNYGASNNPYILKIVRLIKIKILLGFLHRTVELMPKHVEESL
jgi:hypothetical protein